ncbi:MAG TPA: alpha/beta fold hydrolase [Jiangellaceae bacterium]
MGRQDVDVSSDRRIGPAAVVRGIALEIAWASAHVSTYPLGLLHERRRAADSRRLTLSGLDPVRRGLLAGDVEVAGTPIVMVHGIADNRTTFTVMRRALRRRGFERVVSVDYGWLATDLRTLAARLGAEVGRVCNRTGYERVNVVAHSMGGLVARYYVQRLGGHAKVRTLVTLGTPHAGTRWAAGLPHPLLRQLRPGSRFLAELAAPSPGCRTRFVVVWSDLDQVVVPHSNARLRHVDLDVREIAVHGVGHMSLPVDSRVVHEVCTALFGVT